MMTSDERFFSPSLPSETDAWLQKIDGSLLADQSVAGDFIARTILALLYERMIRGLDSTLSVLLEEAVRVYQRQHSIVSEIR